MLRKMLVLSLIVANTFVGAGVALASGERDDRRREEFKKIDFKEDVRDLGLLSFLFLADELDDLEFRDR